MNDHRKPFSGTLIAWLASLALLLPLASGAWADDDDHHGHHRHGWYHDRDDDGDHARWWREHHESDHDGHVHGDNTRDCRAIHDRIHYDEAQVREIAPTGRHEKAMQWYKDDIENAHNDLRSCQR